MPRQSTAAFSAEQAQRFLAKKKNRHFPLRWHPNGGWCKNILGHRYYWGKCPPDEALNAYLADKPYLERGEEPPPRDGESVTIQRLLNEFLSAKKSAVSAGELSQEHWQDLYDDCEKVAVYFGLQRSVVSLQPADFAALRESIAKGRRPTTVIGIVARLRTLFRFAFDHGLVVTPLRYHKTLTKPTAAVIRRELAAQGRRVFLPHEFRGLWNEADGQLKTMIGLAVCCGLGPADLGRLPIETLDLDAGLIDYPRPKTGLPRRAAVWPELVDELRSVIGGRAEGLVFSTHKCHAWSTTAICHEFRRLADGVGLTKRGRGMYGLRRTCRTIASELNDAEAADLLMGHSRPGMATLYVQHIDDSRLRRIADHLRQRLLVETEGEKDGEA